MHIPKFNYEYFIHNPWEPFKFNIRNLMTQGNQKERTLAGSKYTLHKSAKWQPFLGLSTTNITISFLCFKVTNLIKLIYLICNLGLLIFCLLYDVNRGLVNVSLSSENCATWRLDTVLTNFLPLLPVACWIWDLLRTYFARNGESSITTYMFLIEPLKQKNCLQRMAG